MKYENALPSAQYACTLPQSTTDNRDCSLLTSFAMSAKRFKNFGHEIEPDALILRASASLTQLLGQVDGRVSVDRMLTLSEEACPSSVGNY